LPSKWYSIYFEILESRSNHYLGPIACVERVKFKKEKLYREWSVLGTHIEVRKVDHLNLL